MAIINILILSVHGQNLTSVCAGIVFIRQNLTSKDDPRTERINPLTAKLFNLNFHPLEVVSR